MNDMTLSATNFDEFTLPSPMYDDVAAEYAQLNAELDLAATGAGTIAAVEKWDALRRRLYTWTALVDIRFRQNTQNEQYRKDRQYCDELRPKLTNLAVQVKRRLMDSPHRPAIEARFGRHAFELWQCDIAVFNPAIEQDLVEESKLVADYTELLASGKFEFRGETHTLSQMMKFDDHSDREVRHDAAAMRWQWFAEHCDQFDAIYDTLVRRRQTIAEKLGFKNFVPVGYQRMKRIGYDQNDVARFRGYVREHVVPLATEMRRQQAQKLRIDTVMAWDESIHDPVGNPKPQGDPDWMTLRAQEMFNELGGGMDELFSQMRAQNLMDLKSRPGKSAGGFCDVLPGLGMPFIYANSDGTMKDVTVFTHEMGHAFQCYSSLEQPLWEYVMATEDAAEIHSMSLEFLTWPKVHYFFGDDASRYHRIHLTKQLQFFPYGVAVDHFQHLVYENPHSTPEERARMWQEMEQMYLPSLQWGDLAHPASGRRWQAQLHLFSDPFYYIDYTLALTCALQFWLRAREDRDAALAAYIDLCRRGGSAPFGQLVKSAGLVSPFEEGCLDRVVDQARRELTTPTT